MVMGMMDDEDDNLQVIECMVTDAGCDERLGDEQNLKEYRHGILN